MMYSDYLKAYICIFNRIINNGHEPPEFAKGGISFSTEETFNFATGKHETQEQMRIIMMIKNAIQSTIQEAVNVGAINRFAGMGISMDLVNKIKKDWKAITKNII